MTRRTAAVLLVAVALAVTACTPHQVTLPAGGQRTVQSCRPAGDSGPWEVGAVGQGFDLAVFVLPPGRADWRFVGRLDSPNETAWLGYGLDRGQCGLVRFVNWGPRWSGTVWTNP